VNTNLSIVKTERNVE